MLSDHKETFHSSVHSLRICDRIRNERQKANLNFRHAWFRKQVSHTCPSWKTVRYYRQLSCISDATNDELNKLVYVGLLVIDFWSFTKSSDSTVKVSGISRDFCILKSQICWQGSVFNLVTVAKGTSFFYGLFVNINRTSHLTQNHVTDYLKNILFCKVIS